MLLSSQGHLTPTGTPGVPGQCSHSWATLPEAAAGPWVALPPGAGLTCMLCSGPGAGNG